MVTAASVVGRRRLPGRAEAGQGESLGDTGRLVRQPASSGRLSRASAPGPAAAGRLDAGAAAGGALPQLRGAAAVRRHGVGSTPAVGRAEC